MISANRNTFIRAKVLVRIKVSKIVNKWNQFRMQKMCPLCPLAGPTMPVAWASTAHQVGIHRTSAGHQQNKRWATSAQKAESILGNTDKSLQFTIAAFYSGTFCLEQWRKELFRCVVGEGDNLTAAVFCRWNEVSCKEKVK